MKGGAPNEAFEEQLGTEITRRMWFMETRVRKGFQEIILIKKKKKPSSLTLFISSCITMLKY